MRFSHVSNPSAIRIALRVRRGVAMLLVLISLMMATVLATAYLASRDNSAAIGSNASAAAAARWTADSGLEMAIAILQTEATWRTSHVSGRLVSNLSVAGGTTNIDLVDIETGLAPNASTDHVRVTSTGTVDGVNQTAVAECLVPLTSGEEIDVDLSEFAVFASQKLEMADQSTVARWPKAPLSAMGYRVRVGTQATSASAINLAGDAASLDTTVFSGPGASAMLVAVANSQPPESKSLLDAIPMPTSPASGVADPPASSTAADLTQSSGSAITAANTRWKNVALSNTAVRMLRGNITAVTDEDLTITNGAKLIIDGQVKLVVFGNTLIDGGAIELKAGSRLTMFVRGRSVTALELRNGYIGDLRSTATRDNSGKASYMNPERVLVFGVPGADADWLIRDNSVVKASIYAPEAKRVEIRDASALYGRVAAKELRLNGGGTVFYDPALDSRAGYSNPESALWDASSRLKNEVKSIVSLDATSLQTIADSLGKKVLALAGLDGLFTPATSTSTTPPVVAPTDPTPRTVMIETHYVTFGNALDSWE